MTCAYMQLVAKKKLIVRFQVHIHSRKNLKPQSGILCRVVSRKLTDVSEVLTAPFSTSPCN
jgi:hypothetical protein